MFLDAFRHLILRLRRDLRLQIAFFYLLFVAPVVIIGFYIGSVINARLQADVMQSDLALARTIAQETELNLTNARYAVQELARYSEVFGADQAAVEELYTKLAGTQAKTNPISLLGDWWVIEKSSSIGADMVPPGALPSQDFAQYSDVFNSYVSSGWQSPTMRQPVATSVVPLWDDLGNLFGVVVGHIKLDALSASLTKIINEYQISSSDEYEVMVVDSSRKIVAHPDRRMLLRSAAGVPTGVVTAVLQGQEGNLIAKQEEIPQELFSYAPIPSASWGVIISRPTSVAFATANGFTRSMLFVVVFFSVVGLIFWIGLSIKVIRPLEKLAIYSQSISSNEKLSTKQRTELSSLSNRSDQVGHLTETLVKMETDIEARLEELATLLQTSAVVVSTLESQDVLDRILDQVERLLDVEMSAIVALDRRDGVFRTQASRGITPEHAAQLTASPHDTDSMILRALRNRAPIQIRDTEGDASFSALKMQAREAGYRSALAIPLKTLYAPPSALLIFNTEPYIFSESEISLLTNFANHAAMAIENAALYARSDMQLQEQTRRLEALIQSLKDGLILENLEGKIVYANRQISRLVNCSIEEIVGTSVEDVFNLLLANVEDSERIRVDIQSSLDQTDLSVSEFEIDYRGRKVNLRIQVFKVTDSRGFLIGRGRIFSDVTADRQLDHMKSRLVSTVSHELRTPLASIKGYATTLLAEDVEWDRVSQREFLTVISSETDRLSSMVTDLLDLSKIEAGSLAIHRSEVHLDEIVSLASQRAYPRPNGRLHIDIPPELPVLHLDKRLIEAVFRNLIENATKYAGEDSPITISAKVQNGKVMVYVQDEGPGIPVQYQERIFESFFRPDENSLRMPSGFGLGLTICKGFVESHGGNIWVEPCSLGACFGLSFPLDEN
ncbi:MAG TPA: hypothetical protein DEH25_05405 [Chloroflexi bacterium]|nr:hypothetical protein [Chloroflexota bacterium]HBY07720.1 hypothetical protein [Chloroflexota bacterium]